MDDRDTLQMVQLVGFVVAIGAAIWTYMDARSLRQRGARLTPVLWAILTFLALILALPAYLILRISVWNPQVNRLRRQGGSDGGDEPESAGGDDQAAAEAGCKSKSST